MAKNNHQPAHLKRELLDIKFFSQPFLASTTTQLQLDECKLIAQLYAGLENTISVLSDMKARKSYIYPGGAAGQLGLDQQYKEINSIWEDDLLSRVHPDDLQKKYSLEYKFFKLLKSIGAPERLDYTLCTRLRVKNDRGKYIPVQHRLLYLSSCDDGNIWMALCLYHTVYNYPGFEVPEGVIINTRTGQAIEGEESLHQNILTSREQQILKLIGSGMRSKEIAGILSLSIHTINRHRQNIFHKLNVNNALEACKVAAATRVIS